MVLCVGWGSQLGAGGRLLGDGGGVEGLAGASVLGVVIEVRCGCQLRPCDEIRGVVFVIPDYVVAICELLQLGFPSLHSFISRLGSRDGRGWVATASEGGNMEL